MTLDHEAAARAEAASLALAAISNPLRRKPSVKAFFKASAADPLLNYAATLAPAGPK